MCIPYQTATTMSIKHFRQLDERRSGVSFVRIGVVIVISASKSDCDQRKQVRMSMGGTEHWQASTWLAPKRLRIRG